MRVSCFVLILSFLAAEVRAQEQKAAPVENKPSVATAGKPIVEKKPARPLTDRPEGPSVIGVVFWTAFVIVIIFGLWLLMRKLMRSSKVLFPGGAIRILARRRLTPAQDLYLIELGPRLLLVGVTKSSMSTLSELSSPTDIAAMRSQFASGDPKSFQGVLKAEVAGTPIQEPRVSQIKGRLDDLKRMISNW